MSGATNRWIFEITWPTVEVIGQSGEVYRGTQVFGWVFWKDKFGEYHNQWTGIRKGEVVIGLSLEFKV